MIKGRYIRLFVAVELPSQVIRLLEGMIEGWKAEGLESLRWIGSKGFHLTLKFLGDVSVDRVPFIGDALAEVAERHRSFSLETGDCGLFLRKSAPQALWIGVRGGLDALDALRWELDELLYQQGFPKEHGKFFPHITLGRVPRNLTLKKVKQMEEILLANKREIHQFQVSQASLIWSKLTRTSAEYRRLTLCSLDTSLSPKSAK